MKAITRREAGRGGLPNRESKTRRKAKKIKKG